MMNRKETVIFKSSFSLWLMLVLAMVFYFYEYILRVSPSVMAHELMSAYQIQARTFGNLSAQYYYIYAPMQIIVGLLMDRYGPRRLLAGAAFISGLGVYFFASTPYLAVAEIGRFLIGLGSSFAFVGVLKIASMRIAGHQFAFITGITVALGVLGGIVGDFSLTYFVDQYGWRVTCYFLAGIGFLLAFLNVVAIRDREVDKDALNPIMLVTNDFRSLLKKLYCLIRQKQIWINGLIGCLLYLPISGFAESWAIPYLMQSYHFNHEEAAAASSSIFLGWLIGAPFIGLFSDAIRQRRLPLTIGATMGAILLSYVLYVPEIDTRMVLFFLFVFGFFTSAQATVFSVSREISSPDLAATAIALTNMIIMLSGLSVYLIGVLLDRVWTGVYQNGIPYYTMTEYQIALLILPVGLLVAVFMTFFLKETYGKVKDENDNDESPSL